MKKKALPIKKCGLLIFLGAPKEELKIFRGILFYHKGFQTIKSELH